MRGISLSVGENTLRHAVRAVTLVTLLQLAGCACPRYTRPAPDAAASAAITTEVAPATPASPLAQPDDAKATAAETRQDKPLTERAPDRQITRAAPATAKPAAPGVAKPLPAPKSTTKQAKVHVEEPKVPPLDLDLLEKRLRETKAIGVFTKLALKNQVDELMDNFRAYYQGRSTASLPQLRQNYEMLIMKVLALLQDRDPPLARDIHQSREAIWKVLTDPEKFASTSRQGEYL